MKNDEKKIIKIIKKGFSVSEWETFDEKIKSNPVILSNLIKEIENFRIERIKDLTLRYPFIIKYLAKDTQLKLINNENFKYMSDDLQLEIIEKNNNKVKYASEEAQIEFATKNPLKLSFINEDIQIKMIEKNKFYLEYASKDIQVKIARKNIDLLTHCSNMIQCLFIKNNPNYYPKCSSEVKKKIIQLDNLDPKKINVQTFESYLSNHYDNLSLDELKKYKIKIEATSREDKKELIDYMQYLLTNLEKRKR